MSFLGKSLKALLAPVLGGVAGKPCRQSRPEDGAPGTFREISVAMRGETLIVYQLITLKCVCIKRGQ
ncbi:MAG: hypothetical protein Kow0063_25040 [Anaerolineae bacterium]